MARRIIETVSYDQLTEAELVRIARHLGASKILLRQTGSPAKILTMEIEGDSIPGGPNPTTFLVKKAYNSDGSVALTYSLPGFNDG